MKFKIFSTILLYALTCFVISNARWFHERRVYVQHAHQQCSIILSVFGNFTSFFIKNSFAAVHGQSKRPSHMVDANAIEKFDMRRSERDKRRVLNLLFTVSYVVSFVLLESFNYNNDEALETAAAKTFNSEHKIYFINRLQPYR